MMAHSSHEEERERALVAFESGDMPSARRLLPRVCRRSPDDALALAYLAACLHEREGRSHRVQKLLERAKRGTRDVGVPFRVEGVLFVNEGNLQGGIEMLRQSVALDTSLYNRIILASHLELLKTTEADVEAISLYEGCLREAPECEEVYGRLSWLLLERGKVEEATRLLSYAVRRLPENAELQYSLAACYREASNWDWAVFHLEQALALNYPMPADVEFALAEAKLALGDRRAAKRHAQACLAIDPTHEAASALIKTLGESTGSTEPST